MVPSALLGAGMKTKETAAWEACFASVAFAIATQRLLNAQSFESCVL
jgi:hypothetical protein